MRYALAIIGILALYWCLINLAAVWRAHIEERRRAEQRLATLRRWGEAIWSDDQAQAKKRHPTGREQ